MTNPKQTLALFDLDNTLIAGDSDHAWGEFLIQENLVNADTHREQNDAFYNDYLKGELDIKAYLQFALQPLKDKSPKELKPLHDKFMHDLISPMMLPKAKTLLEKHRQSGDYLLIVTATNEFITRPIAEALGVDDILASEVEIHHGRYTGEPTGIPCFQEGKVIRLTHWLKEKTFDLKEAWFYSDSHNDIPLLNAVGNPVVVDGDNKLCKQAQTSRWPIISLRD